MTKSISTIFFASGYASAEQPGIQSFLFNETTGEITELGSFTGISAPSFLLAHPNGRWLYAVSETGKDSHGALGEVWSFQFEREPFFIQSINHQTTRGDWPCHLQLDMTGDWLIATNYGTGNAAIYHVQADGSLGEMTDFVQHQGKGPNSARQEASHAHSSIFTPDNHFTIIADLGIDQLVVYKVETSSGKLLLHSSVNTRPGSGPRHLVFHPNGKWMYVANELNSTVSLYDYDVVSGTLHERQSLPTSPFDSPMNIVADIHITASGTRVYVSNRGHNSIAVYDVGADGSLTLVSMPSCGGNWPRNFALSLSERFMLVANQRSNVVCALPILSGIDGLGAPVARVSVAGASSIQFVGTGMVSNLG
jgi:6-phosphogluconolactonase